MWAVCSTGRHVPYSRPQTLPMNCFSGSPPSGLLNSELLQYLRGNDDHAEHHITLLQQAETCLKNPSVDAADRMDVAGRIERWRYQTLNEWRDEPVPGQEQLIDSLDRWTCWLRQIDRETPRSLRHHLTSASSDDDTWQAAIDGRMAMPELCEAAQQKTHRLFSVSVSDQPNATKRRMLLYAPLYVSSHCVNHCVYCGFKYDMDIQRTHLDIDDVMVQADILLDNGFQHQLLVAGDFPRLTTTSYFCDLIQCMRDRGLEISIEIASQSSDSYQAMADAGATGLTLYQETYDPEVYRLVHPRGPKQSYDWRLEAPERAAETGFSRIGIGVLLGLADPVSDVQMMIRHAKYLKHQFPHLRLALSLPRLHQTPDGYQVKHPIDDEQLIRFYAACRLAIPDVELVLSTREPAALRDRLAKICITQMSAGSSTTPGGYQSDGCKQDDADPDGQFPVTDQRSVHQVRDWLCKENFDVRWRFA